MLDYLPVEADNHALINAMAEPDIRIVSLTITEGGYYQDPATGKLDITHPDILYDAKHPARPRTAFGAMLAALRARRDRGAGPFTGLSCDNLQGNGTILRQAIIGLAELSDTELAAWIDCHCSFPNSMVDCIVPATGPAELALVKKLGIEDSAPVTHEDFRQWVIEDNFCAGRPDWDKVGAEFSWHVHQHETQKIRMLNGGHQILANAAEIMGLHTISQAMRHPLIGAMFAKVQQEEILPHITPPPGHGVSDYLAMISTRFANDAIIDTVRRVAFDGAARHVGFILPSLRDGLTKNSSITGLALIEAIWARMCLGLREDGSVIEANDPSWEMLIQIACQARTAPRCWLEMSYIYGDL
ncbi:MAG: mannitol dehydrogenase family protein, partial [Candidatus Puniceispirillaceae bacterium]